MSVSIFPLLVFFVGVPYKYLLICFFLFQHRCGLQLYSLSQLISPSSPSPWFSLRPRCFNFPKPNRILRKSTAVFLASCFAPAVPTQHPCPTLPEIVCLYSARTKTCWQPWLNSSTLTTDWMSRTAAFSGRWLNVRTPTCSWAWRSLSCEQSWPGEGWTLLKSPRL